MRLAKLQLHSYSTLGSSGTTHWHHLKIGRFFYYKGYTALPFLTPICEQIQNFIN